MTIDWWLSPQLCAWNGWSWPTSRTLDITIDLQQCAYRMNLPCVWCIICCHPLCSQSPRGKGYIYVGLLFLDFSSAFSTIIPHTLVNKLRLLGLKPSVCNWVLDFLIGRTQTVKIHDVLSSTITLKTGSPQGCVLSPLLYTLLTHAQQSTWAIILIILWSLQMTQPWLDWSMSLCTGMKWKI